ncbi:uncharacterized protein LOC125206511 [Salvia hispanica]|uniref:uncharacterized protein LOC125206511 n=1 Tax=Salvia hispanica TaxID=49212 RepID=UPI0020092EAF|nr:uncharacterized protein LOC125206511 [Salvia hispanica]
MATTSVLAATLPKLVVIKSKAYSDKGNAYFKADGGSVLLGEDNVFSTLVKIEVERSPTHTNYVNIRFGYFNRYWQRKENDKFIVAKSDQPEEDVTKTSCTLFEPVEVNSNCVFYLRHVQSGGRVSVDGSSKAFYLSENSGDDDKSYLTFVDWNTLVKLPAKVAFKGDNGKYMTSVLQILQFASEDPNDEYSSFVVEMMPDGQVRMTQEWASPGVYCSVDTTSPYQVSFTPVITPRINFWPVKIDENSIALRSADTDKFCIHNTNVGIFGNGVTASASTITKEAIMAVEESVVGRKIYNVVYQMEYARIFDEVP